MKRWLLLLIALLVITACRPEAGLGDAPTGVPAATEDLGICPPGDEGCDEVAEATAVPTARPTATAQPAAQAPAPIEDPFALRDTDWVKGADDPIITLIEYADFF
jgi:hypothetical protein